MFSCVSPRHGIILRIPFSSQKCFFNWRSSNSLFLQGRNSWRDSQRNSTKCLICCGDQNHRSRSGLARLVWTKSSLSKKSRMTTVCLHPGNMPGAGHRACAGWVVGGSAAEPKGTCPQHSGVESLSLLITMLKTCVPDSPYYIQRDTVLHLLSLLDWVYPG